MCSVLGDMNTLAAKVAHRYIEKMGAKVDIKVKYPAVKGLKLEGTPGGWAYAYVAANGLTNTWKNKDRDLARVKLIRALKEVIEPRDVEKLVRELDEKYDSAHGTE